MPFNPPRLDDRNFEGLLTDLVQRIPAHTPEWTNPRVGDPGYTLLELFAWLADTILYRANLIPERQRLVFLKLLGIQQRSAIPARGMVALKFAREDASTPVLLRSGATVTGPVAFETLSELHLLPVHVRAYAKTRLSAEETTAMGPLISDLEDLYKELLGRNDDGRAVAYTTMPAFAEGAVDDGFDFVERSVDHALWFALLSAENADPSALASLLLAGNAGSPWIVNIGWSPAVTNVDPLDELPARKPIGHVWEVMTNEVIEGEHTFRALDVVSDTTLGLTRDGVLRLALSAGSFGVPSTDLNQNPVAGVGKNSPPRIDDPNTSRRIVAWLRLRPTERIQTLPVAWVGANALEIEQTRAIGPVVVASSDGSADQVVSLSATSVIPDSLDLQVEEGSAGYQTWQRVDDVAAFGRDARVYSLDSEAGSARFGNGVQGRVPTAGARIRVRALRAGGGAQGNLPAGSLKSIRAFTPQGALVVETMKVLQPQATRGGTDAESLVQAEQRIPASLRHRNRAVTQDDYVNLAAVVPGLRVGRVEVLARFKPQQRRQDVPGVVSVMVLPTRPTATFEAPAPRPDRPFLEATHAWLEKRRSLGTELYVIGAEYVPVGVSVGVDIRPGYDIEVTLANVRKALRVFLWALPPGGPLGRGWELGAALAAGQLEVAAARVRGVSSVRGLNLFTRGARDWQLLHARRAEGAQLTLSPWQLPELLGVVAVNGAAPTDLRGLPNPFDGGDASFAIPVVPEVC